MQGTLARDRDATAAAESASGGRLVRVAALIDSAILSGPGRQLTALARALRPHGAEILVVLFRREGRRPSALIDHLDAAGVDYVELPESGPLDIGLATRVEAVLRQRDIQIVQTHSYRTTAIVWLLRRSGRLPLPWIAFQHGATAQNRKVRFYHWLDHRLAPAADRIVVMSAGHRDRWKRHEAKVRVIHNAVVPLQVTRVAEHEPLVAGPRPAYGVVGRLSFEKGVDVFLHACALLRQRGRGFSALVVGDGPEKARLSALAQELEIRDVVTFHAPTPDVASVYRAVDALVIPSRSEGLPNVLLEALSQDVPVVSTAVGAMIEVLSEAAAGCVVPPNDATALADAMERIIELGRSTEAQEARRRCVDRYSLDRRVAAHLGLYREVAGAARVAPTP